MIRSTCTTVVLTALVAGCPSLPPAKPIDGAANLAGTWTYREVAGAISVVRPGLTRYAGTNGNGRVTFYETGDRRVLRFVGDGGGRGAELTPAK